jgi:hypothetical protein
MPGEVGYLVEEFINAITSQLDRVQDALRLKAVNRPLTYALKDLALDLQVFVDMDGQGNVRFRASGPNETGASTIRLGFTTITRPMVEENTISIAMTRSPGLAELGLDDGERQRLEQLGVRNAAQLRRLDEVAGARTVARLTDVPENRIRTALQFGQPRLSGVQPEPALPASPPTAQPHVPPRTAPVPRIDVDGHDRPHVVHQPVIGFPSHPVVPHDGGGHTPWTVGPTIGTVVPSRTLPVAATPIARGPVVQPVTAPAPTMPVLRVAPEATRLRLRGQNLLGEEGPPVVRLNGRQLAVQQAEEDQVLVKLPPERGGGRLEIEMPDGEALAYELAFDPVDDRRPEDPWAPGWGAE